MANCSQNNVSCFDDSQTLSSNYYTEGILVMTGEEFPKDEKIKDWSEIHQGTKT